MASREPVESAETVAAVRAFGVRDPRARNPDHLARHFLRGKYQSRLWILSRSIRLGRWLMEKKAPGTYWYLQARTKHIDLSFVQAIQDGVAQIVFLGAGYDTRAYRFRELLGTTRVFEVDVAPTQEQKRWHLQRLFGEIPAHVTFVPIDFNRDALPESLRSAGFDSEAKTLFVWEGVMYYLPEDSVRAVLRDIRGLVARGSRLVFDYVLQQALDGDGTLYGAAEAMKIWQDLGEPGLFGFHGPPEARRFLAEHEFDVQSDLGSIELADCYGRVEDDPRAPARIIECMRILDAEAV